MSNDSLKAMRSKRQTSSLAKTPPMLTSCLFGHWSMSAPDIVSAWLLRRYPVVRWSLSKTPCPLQCPLLERRGRGRNTLVGIM